MAVGMTAASTVHFTLAVSFLIVINVVAQGQWNKLNNIVFSAVNKVQPLSTKTPLKESKFCISTISPVDKYAIRRIGRTISFAGSPKIKAISIKPSKPITLAKGSKNPAAWAMKLDWPIYTFANIHISIPAGAATTIALPRTNMVLSINEVYKTLPIWGLLYGGNSNVNDEGTPFKIVFDNP